MSASSGRERLNALMGKSDSSENEESTEKETTSGSGRERLNALMNSGSNKPANAESKAATQRLLDTGYTSYHGHTYTLPEKEPEVPDDRSLWEKTVDFITSRRGEASLGAAMQSGADTLGGFRIVSDIGYQSGIQDYILERNLATDEKALSKAEEKLAAAQESGANQNRIDRLQRNVDMLTFQRDQRQQMVDEDINRQVLESYDRQIADLSERGQQHIENAKEGLGKVGQTLVDVGAQTTQMAIDNLAGVISGAGMAPFAFRAFGGGVQEAKDNGGNLWQQIAYGAAQAAKEVGTEKIFGIATPFKTFQNGSADDIVDALIDSVSGRVKEGAARFLVKSALTGASAYASEFSEEAIGNLIEWATQMKRIYGGDPGTFREALKSGIQEGNIAGLSALFGAPAGAVTERVGQNMQYNKQYPDAEYRKAYGAAIAAEAAELNPDSRYAAKQNASAEAGKTLKGYDVNKLFEMNEDALRSADVDALRSATEARLKELGETGDVSKIASGIAKTVAGKSTDVFGNRVSAADALRTFGGVSLSEQAAIRKSQYGQQVLNELQNGGMEWTGRIETERLNPEVYGRLLEEARVERTPTFDEVVNSLKNPGSARFMNTASENPTPTVQTAQNAAEAPQNAPKAAAPATPDATGNVTEQPTASIDELSAQYGKQAEAFRRTYNEGQDVEQYAAAYRQMFDYGKSQFNYDYASSVESVSYLTDDQKRIAWETGRASGRDLNAMKNARNASDRNGKTGRRKGAVSAGEGVSYENFNRQQKRGYRILSKIAEATGLDIELYSSQADENGKYPRIQGRYDPATPERIYIDINSGLMNAEDATQLGKYAMVRTFTHEFTHAIERFSPDLYDELRGAVWEAIGSEYADSLVVKAMSEQQDLTYNQASREVVAEALTDILPDSKFVNNLAQKHQNLFQRLLSELKDFLSDIRDYFSEIGWNSYGGAQALKREADGAVRYVENIVEIFDRAAENAVETFQSAYAVEEQAEADTKGQEQAEAEAEETDTAKAAETEAAVNEPAVESAEATEESATTEETASEPASKEAPATAENQGEAPAENPENTVDTAPETPTMEEGPNYTVRNNYHYGSAEVSFDGVPSEAVRNALKARKFKWNGKRKVWYGKSSVDEIQNLLDSLYGKTAEKGESENGEQEAERGANGTMDGGRGGNVEGSDTGRPGSGTSVEASGTEENLPRDGGSGNGSVLQRNEAGGDEGRNGRGDREGNGEGLLADGDAGMSVPESGESVSGLQGAESVTGKNARNYRVSSDIDNIRPNYRDNIVAIDIVKKLQRENRAATPEERADLAKYKGWGALKNLFFADKDKWQGRDLKRSLTPEEYEAAKASVLNAHYTSTRIIDGVYRAVERLGFKGGKILEPSMGVGNFFGRLPQSLSEKSDLYGVELDNITGTIAKNLYPDAQIEVSGFQDVIYPNDTFDVVVGNVPFSVSTRIPYRGKSYALHDFFFLKALDDTRPGGIVALITSTGTLDKIKGSVVREIESRANLVAAFRLPDNAFALNAGTSVTTDLIILQKREAGAEPGGEAFTSVGDIEGIPINEYYVNHPENILGTLAYEKNGMYQSERTVVHSDGNFEQEFEDAISRLPENLMNRPAKNNSGTVRAKKRGEKKKTTFRVTENGAALVDGETGSVEKVKTDTQKGKEDAKIIESYVQLKETFGALIDAEKSGNMEAAEQYRKRLNEQYDTFVRKYGNLSKKNRKLLSQDDDFIRMSGLEIEDKDGIRKSQIFSRATVNRAKRTSAATAQEALSISLSEDGRVDIPHIAKLLGTTEEQAVKLLGDDVIYTPDGEYVLTVQYASGDIYKKLDAIEGKDGFDRQREVLKKALPRPKTKEEVVPSIGSHWIDPQYVSDFLTETFSHGGGRIEADFSPELGRWDVTDFKAPNSPYSTKYVSASELVKSTLNGKNVRVIDRNKVELEDETQLAQERQNALREDFKNWVFKDKARTEAVLDRYNRSLNAVAPVDYAALADKIDYGIPADYKKQPRDYQKGAIARVVFGGNTLLHHGVGTGKTLTMIVSAHVMKQNGTANKPMFVVPNGKVNDFRNEILELYPDANILALDEKNMNSKEIQRTKAQIATGDWDYVLVSHSRFQQFSTAPETEAEFLEDRLERFEEAVRASAGDKNGKSRFETSLISSINTMKEKIKKLRSKPKDEATYFEDMGIDALFVDEAHNFKKVGFATTFKISGIDSSTNARTTDLYLKEQWIRSHGGKIILATATPITNTLSEMYNMAMHVSPETYENAGIMNFDTWMNAFANIEDQPEIAPDGKTWRNMSRVRGFRNGNEMIGLYRQFADVIQTQDVVKGLPKAKYINVVSPPTAYNQVLLDSFAKRSELAKKRGRKNEKGGDNMLLINSDGRAAGTDLRLLAGVIGEMFPGVTEADLDVPDSKINKAAGLILDEYQKSMDIRGTQFVFLDAGVKEGDETSRYRINLYADLISKLVKAGIPRSEIANIQDYDGEAKREKLYRDMNSGAIRVLIGSTAKMGEGVNAQERAVALHHLSVPQRPDNLEQREGRVIRFGNINKEVRIYRYTQEKSYDSYLWQMIERKAAYSAQALNGGDASELEEIGDVQLNAREQKAIATGNPLVMEKFTLQDKATKLENLIYTTQRERKSLQDDITDYTARLKQYRAEEYLVKSDIATIEANKSEDFSITIGKTTYDNRSDAAKALEAAAIPRNYGKKIGEISGLPLYYQFDRERTSREGNGRSFVLKGESSYETSSGDSAIGNITRVLNLTKSPAETLKDLERYSDYAEKAISGAEESLKKNDIPKWTKELNQIKSRLREVDTELGILKGEESIEAGDEETTQYQVRQIFGDSGTEYGIGVYLDSTLLSNLTDSQRVEMVKEYIRDIGGQSFVAYDNSGSKVSVRVAKSSEKFVNERGKLVPVNRDLETKYRKNIVKQESVVLLDELVSTSSYRGQESAKHSHGWIDNNGENPWEYWKTFVQDKENTVWEATLNVATSANGEKILYDVWPIKMVEQRGESRLSTTEDSVTQAEGESQAQNQQRTSPMTDREILSIAGSRVDPKNLTPGEIDALRIFNERADKLNELTIRRQEEGQKYREQQFGKNVNREEAQKTLNRMKILDDQIKRASDALLQVEQAEVMRRVLQQARKIVTEEERTHGKELLNRYRDRTKNAAAIKKYRERIQKDVKDLSSWLLHPGNKDINKHVPEALRETVIRFLTDIDFTSKRQLRGGEATKADEAFAKSLDRLAAVLRPDASPEAAYLQYQLPEDFVKQITDMANEVRALTGSMGGADLVINRMSAEELQGLSKIVRILKTTLIQMNQLHQNAIFAHVDTAAQSTTEHLHGMTSAKHDGALNKFVMWDNMRPAYAFERFGEGGKSIFDELIEGQDTFGFLSEQLKTFTEETYTTEEAKSWEEEEVTVEIGGEKVSMPVSYLMSLYCLKDRKRALQHLLGGGLRVATHKEGKAKYTDYGHRITKEELDAIFNGDALSTRQKEVARTLQQYMATVGSEWGNYVSFARWGENALGDDPNYFPINSDGKLLPSNADENPANASLYALLNMSFTKELSEKANNRLMLYSIFDVFANHMASMAQYRSFALPVLDSLKWLNYGSVREEMTRVYGQPEEKKPGSGVKGYAESFVINFIRAASGTEAQGIPTDSAAVNALKRYNVAQVAYNLGVVMQQPLSIVRAGSVIDTRSILEGIAMPLAQRKKNTEDMYEHSGIAKWKRLGFYDINISNSLTDIVKHKKKFADKVNEVGMFGAGMADEITWGAMWYACKKKVTRKTGLKDGEAFYKAVNRLFNEVIYKTQVVDTFLTKTEFLRSKGFVARAVGSFMSESVATANMVIVPWEKYNEDMLRGMSKSEAWRRNGGAIVRNSGLYAISAILGATVTALRDALRDDDDYETLPQKWLEAFGGNLLDELNPLNKLPIFRDLYELAKSLMEKLGFDTYGNEPRSILFQWSNYLLKGTEILMDLVTGEKTNYKPYAVVYKYLQAASGMTGLPAAAATRTVVNIWNNTVGALVPSRKIKSYDPSDESEIRYAMQDGYLTEEAAVRALIEAGMPKEKAEETAAKIAAQMRFAKGNKRFAGISEAAAYSFYSKPDGFSMYGSPEDEGIPKETYYHAWKELKSYTGDDNDGDGKNDTYSKLDKQLAYIESLSLTKRQKYALANALTSAAENTILKRANFH